MALVDGLADRLDRPERPDQRGRRLVPHARDPGQAVAGVTAQRRVVGVGAPGDLVPGRDRGLVHDVQLDQAAHGVDHPHRPGVVHQLEQVAVPRDDLDRAGRVCGERADHVVRLVTGRPGQRHPGGGEDLLDDRHLRGERRRDLFLLTVGTGPVRLVGRQRRHPEGRPPVRVQAGHEPVRVPGPDQPGDHVEQPPDGVHRGAVGRGHGLRHAIERAEVQRGGVEQHQRAHLRHPARPGGHRLPQPACPARPGAGSPSLVSREVIMEIYLLVPAWRHGNVRSRAATIELDFEIWSGGSGTWEVRSMCDAERPPADVAGALAMLDHALDHLNATDAASLPASVQAEALRALARAEAKHAAARARVLGAFAVQGGFEDDGHGTARTWLKWQCRVTTGAAAAAVGQARRLAAHPAIAGALAAGELSPRGRGTCATGPTGCRRSTSATPMRSWSRRPGAARVWPARRPGPGDVRAVLP